MMTRRHPWLRLVAIGLSGFLFLGGPTAPSWAAEVLVEIQAEHADGETGLPPAAHASPVRLPRRHAFLTVVAAAAPRMHSRIGRTHDGHRPSSHRHWVWSQTWSA